MREIMPPCSIMCFVNVHEHRRKGRIHDMIYYDFNTNLPARIHKRLTRSAHDQDGREIEKRTFQIGTTEIVGSLGAYS